MTLDNLTETVCKAHARDDTSSINSSSFQPVSCLVRCHQVSVDSWWPLRTTYPKNTSWICCIDILVDFWLHASTFFAATFFYFLPVVLKQRNKDITGNRRMWCENLHLWVARQRHKKLQMLESWVKSKVLEELSRSGSICGGMYGQHFGLRPFRRL